MIHGTGLGAALRRRLAQPPERWRGGRDSNPQAVWLLFPVSGYLAVTIAPESSYLGGTWERAVPRSTLPACVSMLESNLTDAPGAAASRDPEAAPIPTHP
jgi:hypothetical protein